MAEYELTPIEIDADLQRSYETLKGYFIRENNPFKIVSDFKNDDGFTFDITRSYSFVASTFKANVHLIGKPMEAGRTLLTFHVKSAESQEEAEKQIRDRIAESLPHLLGQAEERAARPAPTAEQTAAEKASEKRKFMISAVIILVILVGTLPFSCSEQFSRLWIF